MMPEWLLAVLVAAAISGLVSIGSSYVSHLIGMRVMMQMMSDYGRRISIIEDQKLDHALYASDVRRIDDRLNAGDHEVSNVKQRMVSLDDRMTESERWRPR
jgi:hypothetical protein